MATITPGPTISKIAGSSGDHTYSSWKGRAVLRSKAKNRSNPSSPRQATARAGATALSKSWSEDLTDTQRALWDEAAQAGTPADDPASSREQGSRVVIPQPKPVLSGYDTFVRHNQRAIMTGITPIGTPILTPSPEFPNPVTDLERVVAPPIPIDFALDFDGVNEDVLLGNVLGYEYNQAQAWEWWMHMDSTYDNQRIICKEAGSIGDGYAIGLYHDELSWYIRNTTAGTGIVVKRAFSTTGAWVHGVCTYNGNNSWAGMNIYLNAVAGKILVQDLTIMTSILSATPLLFAAHTNPAGAFLNGRLDCIRNYNRNLVQADVNTLFAAGLGVYSSDPLGDGSCQGAWAFCTGGGNTLFDISGNNYHGALRNMEPGDWVPGKVPCPTIPAVDQIQWTMPTVPAGSKVRIWVLSYDAGVHKQHVATVDSGVGFWVPDVVRIADGQEVPIASMPGHYLVQADVISPGGNQSPPSNTIEITIP